MLLTLVKKLPPQKEKKHLAVPFSITVFKKCIKYKISTDLMKSLHFFDLQCLIIQFEIQDIQEYFSAKEKERLKARGIKEVKDISGEDAIKFLGR